MMIRITNFTNVILAVPKIPDSGIFHFIKKCIQNKVKIRIIITSEKYYGILLLYG